MGKKILNAFDGNTAISRVAYKLNEVIAVYPIPPLDDAAVKSEPNLWGKIPSSKGIKLDTGLANEFFSTLRTSPLINAQIASEGLPFMLSAMVKIAGELVPMVFHVLPQWGTTETHPILSEHSQVMVARTSGFAILLAGSVQEAHDFALIAQASTLESRVPFLHFFDDARQSQENVHLLTDTEMRALIDTRMSFANATERPLAENTEQNTDALFLAREAVNPYYSACVVITQNVMDEFAQLVGRQYRIFEYYGAADADRVIVLMGSACQTAQATVDYLNTHGERVGMVKVRLYRPFDMRRFVESLPTTVNAIAILDRTKEPGSPGEPLYLDCMSAIHEGLERHWGELQKLPKIVGGRYGLSEKAFTPAMVKGVFDNLASPKPKRRFTVGIDDTVSHTSLPYDPQFSTVMILPATNG